MLLAAASLSASPFEPMDFLAGRCFTAALPDGQASDTHCFRWLYPGHFLRDEHVVCANGRVAYQGETTYGLEPLTGQVRWRYLSGLGLTIDGLVMPRGEALHFTGHYVSGTERRDVRAAWTRQGDGYRARSEERTGDAPWQATSDLHFAPDARTRPACD